MSEPKLGVIYSYCNALNDKQYIGLTIQTLHDRHKQHLYLSHKKNTPFYQALRKYPTKFSLIILEENIPQEILGEREQYWIGRFHSFYPKGYNLTTGGESTIFVDEVRKKMSRIAKRQYKLGRKPSWLGKKMSLQLRKKLSQSHMGLPSSLKGRKLTEEHRKKLSENHADISGKNHPMYGKVGPFKGKHHSEETKKRISESEKKTKGKL